MLSRSGAVWPLVAVVGVLALWQRHQLSVPTAAPVPQTAFQRNLRPTPLHAESTTARRALVGAGNHTSARQRRLQARNRRPPPRARAAGARSQGTELAPPPRPSIQGAGTNWFLRQGTYTARNVTMNQLMQRKTEYAANPNRLGVRRDIPLFIKLHKVGSGTVAEIFRAQCGAIATRIDGVFPWKCGQPPHDHWTMATYVSEGKQGFVKCTYNVAPVQLFTIIRDPLEKFVSALYFWTRLIPGKLNNALNKPSSMTVEQMQDLTTELFKEGEGHVGAAGSLLEYTATFGRLKEKELTSPNRPNDADVERGCENLRNDFIVGVTERMNAFIVLVTLENQWPLEATCHYDLHVSKKRPKASQFSKEVIDLIESKLAPDRKIYECAKQQLEARIARHPNFTQALETYESREFQQRCDQVLNARKRSVNSKWGPRMGHDLKCNYWHQMVES